MSSAKTTIKQQNRSSVAPSLPGIYTGISIVSRKGMVGIPILVTNPDELIAKFGTPDPALGSSYYAALIYLSQGNKLWVTRALSVDAKRASAVIRSKVEEVEQGTPDANYEVDPIVKPITGGLTESEFASYQFEQYATTREYEKTSQFALQPVFDTSEIKVLSFDTLRVGASIVLHGNLTDEVQTNPPQLATKYEVTELSEVSISHNKLQLETRVDVEVGMAVMKYVPDVGLEAYPVTPFVTRSETDSDVILVDNADYIAPGDLIQVGLAQVRFESKTPYVEEAKIVKLDRTVLTAAQGVLIWEVTQSEFEERDSLLVTALNPGVWGNSTSVGITPSGNYDKAFKLVVYYNGVLVETHEVTLESQLDGFSRQLFIEDVINGNSNYIEVRYNSNDVTNEGEVQLPLFTDHAYWRRLPDDVFLDSRNTLAENLLKGHNEVKITTGELSASLTSGTRVKFLINSDNFEFPDSPDGFDFNTVPLSAEYKVLSTTGSTLILDRPIQEDLIPLNDPYAPISLNPELVGQTFPSPIYYFDENNNIPEVAVRSGIKYYPVTKLSTAIYNYPIGSTFTVNGADGKIAGKLLDGGVNLITGGNKGSLVSVSDSVRAIKLLSNKEETPLMALMDGGLAHPAYAQALKSVADLHNLTHVFASVPLEAEDAINYKQEIVDYKASTNINSDTVSFFTGWVSILDEYNQKRVWVSPDAFAVAAQSFTTRNYQMWEPAAGWLKGQVDALDVRRKYTEGDRDWFVDNRINPIRYKKGSGLAIWGNETSLTQPGPMQLRSVAMLLIVIKYGLENLLEYKHFDLNNERTWTQTESSINAFMRDEIQAKGGVYSYDLAIKSIITPSDLDNRRMPIFLGFKPTSDLQEIPATLGIFSNSVDITV